jgi:23S rRNA (uridine2552-2'-O)-methyltransferase
MPIGVNRWFKGHFHAIHYNPAMAESKFSPLNPTGKKHKKNTNWMQEHVSDPYVKKAVDEGYRSRAAYKLLEIDDRDKLLRPGVIIVDLGSAPGSWSQAAIRRTGGRATIVATDILEMQGLAGVSFVQGDFTETAALAAIEAAVAGQSVDLVLSDMAPNMTGMSAMDMPRSLYLAELAAEFAVNHLHAEGRFLTKVFQGSGFPEFVAQLRTQFKKVETRKPKASRDRSSELFLLCTGPISLKAGR